MKKNRFFIAAIVIIALVGLSWIFIQDDQGLDANNDDVAGDQAGPEEHSRKSSDRNRKRNPAEAWSLPFSMKPRLDAEQLRQLETDPAQALDDVMAMSDDPGFSALWSRQQHLLVAWTAKDPDGAMRWVNAQGHRVGRADFLGCVAAGHLIREGEGGLQRFINEHNEDPKLPPKYQGGLISFAFRLMGRADTISESLQMLRQSEDSVLAGALVEGISGADRKIAAIDYLEAKKIKVEPNYWSLQVVAAEDHQIWADWAARRQSELLPELIQSWARKDAAAARAWIEQTIPKDDPRRAEIKALIDPTPDR